MSRSVGSLSSEETKRMASELEMLIDQPYKYNFSILRAIELLVIQRVAEKICTYDDEIPLEDKSVTVEIPLFGDLTITPRVFHEKHRLTDESSIHLSFDFVPSNSFKADVLRAYNEKETPIADIFANIYGERLKVLYNSLVEGKA